MADTHDTAALVAQPAVYLIFKQGAYYRPNSQGYTTSAIQAGRYTLADAISITHPNGLDGPRDGMSYLHEGEVIDRDWQAYQAQAAEIMNLSDALEDERLQGAIAFSAGYEAAEAAQAAEIARLTEINVKLCADFNAMNQHGAKQDAVLAAAEARVAVLEGAVQAYIDRSEEYQLIATDRGGTHGTKGKAFIAVGDAFASLRATLKGGAA
jgi:hypothetical protein